MEKNGAINSQTPARCCGGRCQQVPRSKAASAFVSGDVKYPSSDQEAAAMAPRDALDKAIEQAAEAAGE